MGTIIIALLVYCIGAGFLYAEINEKGWGEMYLTATNDKKFKYTMLFWLFIYGLPISIFNRFGLGYNESSETDLFKGFFGCILMFIYFGLYLYLIAIIAQNVTSIN